MTSTPDIAVHDPVPRLATVQGLRLLICHPEPPAGPDRPSQQQTPLPLDDETVRDDPPIDLDRAGSWVAGLGRMVQEVLIGRRPAAQLAGPLDSRSVAYLAAWAKRGSLRPRVVGATRLRVTSASRVEGWITFHGTDRAFVVVLCLHRGQHGWNCRDLRVVAPSGGVAA